MSESSPDSSAASSPPEPLRPLEELVGRLRQAGVTLRAGKSGRIRAAVVDPARPLTLGQWRELAGLPDLVQLDAARCPLASGALEVIAGMERLARLDLSFTPLDDSALPLLARLTSLQLLHLRGVAFSPEPLKRLRQSLLGARIVTG